MATFRGFLREPEASENSSSRSHTSVGAPRICRILPHPNPTLRKRKGYYPYFTAEETRAQGDQVLTWPRSHRELFYSRVCLTSLDFKPKSPQCCAWDGGLPPPPSLGWAPSSQRDPHRPEPTQELPLPPQLDDVSLFDAASANITEHSSTS